ncbi:serine hydrolase [Paenibacillus sp. CAA11]|uniref:serine hydrolase domain-containing protein n=1 Tax=Paenibacillus sp. CAA11 TaxID=1532905 RepID=UPI000D38B634|nr:serine hydrolase [Paenibacillus sp. CAA11]AWB43268.1 serine hydrolase [Paenibacillus sp. CAA11]
MNIQTPILISSSASFPKLPAASPEDTGTDGQLLAAADAAALRRYPKLRSFLVAREGQLIFERYYNGFHAAALNDLRSATKSFVSALVGLLLDSKQALELDAPVWPYVKSKAPLRPDPFWPQVTLRHLLTMTSGLYWETGSKLGEKFIHRFHRSKSWSKFILRLPVIEESIGSFQYRSVDSHLLSVLLTEWTGQSAFELAKQRLFGPLGIDNAAWSASPEGHSTGHIGLFLTSRDMLKLGLLFLQQGRWQQSQLLPAEWVQLSFSPHSEGYPAFGRYGFQWWCAKEDGISFTYAHGHGGQQIYIIPDYSAVCVFTADSQVSRWKNPRQLLKQFVLPSLNSSALEQSKPI